MHQAHPGNVWVCVIDPSSAALLSVRFIEGFDESK